jgi:hypothetical protein
MQQMTAGITKAGTGIDGIRLRTVLRGSFIAVSLNARDAIID